MHTHIFTLHKLLKNYDSFDFVLGYRDYYVFGTYSDLKSTIHIFKSQFGRLSPKSSLQSEKGVFFNSEPFVIFKSYKDLIKNHPELFI